MKASIYNMDCMEAMQEFPDNFFELAIVDPPYGIGAGSKNFINGTSKTKKEYYKKNDWDIEIPKKEYFNELFRVSKNHIIWGGNYFTDYLKPSRCWIFWDKGTGNNSYADGELAYSSFKKTVKVCKISWVGANAKEYNRVDRIHPTQKPVKLYEWLLMNYAKSGDKILDTHLGSGSSAIAAHRLGFKFWGFEIDKDYYDAAVKRINLEKTKLQLF